MPIDVYDKIKHLLEFESEDDFYYLQLLQRKKENPQLGSNSRVIRNYYIRSTKHLEKHYPEIKALCDSLNARAMLRLNKRSFSKVAFKAIVNVANSIGNREYGFVNKSYDRACGQGHNDSNKKWIIDIDSPIEDFYIGKIVQSIHCIEPIGSKVLVELPTKNGVHIITKPFNLQSFKIKHSAIEIHKDNPINLYIP